MDTFALRGGSVPGQTHLRKKRNNQDAWTAGKLLVGKKQFCFGIVSDGCTGKGLTRTETGSALVVRFLRSEITQALSAGCRPNDLPAVLFPALVAYLQAVARLTVRGGQAETEKLAVECLMCTVLGFILDRDDTVVFHSGDGSYLINDQIYPIDQKDFPAYPAYHLLMEGRTSAGGNIVPGGFVDANFQTPDIRRLAISTDGLNALAQNRPEKLEGIWDHEPDAPAGLQWWLNLESGTDGGFRDDCTIVAAKRKSGSSGKEGEDGHDT